MIGVGLGLGMRGASPWSLLRLGSYLALWHRADSVVLNSTAVSSLVDKSGNGRHTPQATAGMQPLYLPTGGPGGRPILRLDGVDDNLYNPAWGVTIPQPFTIFLCCKQYAQASGTKYVLTGHNYVSPGFYRSSVPESYYVDATTTVPTTQNPGTDWHVIDCTFHDAASTVAINNGIRQTIAPGANGISGLCLGKAGGTSGFAAQLDWSELAIVIGDPSSAVRANIKRAMQAFAGF